MLASLKARYPKLLPVATIVAALAAVGGVAAYERASGGCCHEGASCCQPGAACCNGAHKATAQR